VEQCGVYLGLDGGGWRRFDFVIGWRAVAACEKACAEAEKHLHETLEILRPHRVILLSLHP
jgi:uncharacterized protein (DUF58 family)